ncbi:KDO2-lipid IV(A) lauroyltransferase [Dysgonomonadaceae bacterium PH5-43]|nr:KDO2-lipid IV(A) lauroyltransferase [Dysgonomonadaceae bacterium PH5-43]
MNRKLKTFKRKLVLVLLFPFLCVLVILYRVLPLKTIRKFATYVGAKFYKKAKKSRTIALANLNRVYGDTLSEEEITSVAKAVFTEMIKSFFDYMAFSRIKDKQKYFSYIDVEGEEHLKAAYDRGKGVICLVPHLSSWELAAITPPMLGYETSAASKAMKQQLLENMMIKYRKRRGLKNITRVGSYEKLIDVLKNGECLILMIDQDTKVKSVFVDFFGKPAYTPIGASRLALETGAAIVPMVMTRKSNDNYKFIIYSELEVTNTGDAEKDIYDNTLRQTKKIEEIVSTYKEQWVWMHARWRTTPEDVERYKQRKAEKQNETK